MPGQAIDDPILKRFRAALGEIYGDRLERVVLFGSRARGDAMEDSDYDVAVFIKELDLPSRAGSHPERPPGLAHAPPQLAWPLGHSVVHWLDAHTWLWPQAWPHKGRTRSGTTSTRGTWSFPGM